MQPCVYILANDYKGTIYTGVTSNLIKRLEQYQSSKNKSFVSRYKCKNLVYYEQYDSIINAISREKQIKAGSRQQKINLIESVNPTWMDLSNTIF